MTVQKHEGPLSDVKRFIIDANASRFSVKAVANGISTGLGHSPTISIRGFDGEACFVPGTLEAASLIVKIKADSLTVEDEMHAADRQELERVMHQQVLSTSRHPDVFYKSENAKVARLGKGLYRVDLTGHLTLNGITRIQVVSSQVSLGADNLRATGNFEIRQSDFDIKPPNIAGGLLTVRDELKFTFFLVARQPKEVEGLMDQPAALSAQENLQGLRTFCGR